MKSFKKLFILPLLILSFVFSQVLLPSPASAAEGQWEITGNMQAGIGGNTHLVTLEDGRVLAVGGTSPSQFYSVVSQIYDPSTGVWTQTGSLPVSKGQYTPVLLDDGRVLVAGGEPGGGGANSDAEIFDPATGTWSFTGSLNQARAAAATVKLLDGRVLIVSGDVHSGKIFSSEIYDPSTGQWTMVGNVENSIFDSSSGDVALLNDGRVLKVGNSGGGGHSVIAELFDPVTNQWIRTGDMNVGRYHTRLIKLLDGKVLAISGDQWGTDVLGSEIYDPSTGVWTETGDLSYPRDGFGAVLLPDGRVLISGGGNVSGTFHVQSEIYDPSTGEWSVDASMSGPHHDVNMVALPEDKYLIAGGWTGMGTTNTSEIYNFGAIPTPITVTFNSSADTYVKDGQADRNQGGEGIMKIQSSGNNRSLVRFDQGQIQSAIGSGVVLSAKLRVNIVDNANNWGSGRTVDIHRLLMNWAEGNGTENSRGTGSGATWACAIDSIIQNQAKNCSGSAEWEMGQPNNPSVHPWIQSPSDTENITNNQTGVVEYDVTSDVQSFVNGQNSNFGWLIKKTNEGQNGQVSFGTRESASAPQLVITYQP